MTDPGNQEIQLLQRRLSAGRFVTGEGVEHSATRCLPVSESASAEQLLARGCSLLSADAYAAAVPPLRRALDELLERPDARLLGLGCQAAIELHDLDALATLASTWVEVAWQSDDRVARASSLLYRGGVHEIIIGRLDDAAETLTRVSEHTRPDDFGLRDAVLGLLLVAAWRGHEEVVHSQAAGRIEAAVRDGRGAALNAIHYMLAVLNNGLDNYEAARRAAAQACDHGWFAVRSLALPELVEAAARSRSPEMAATAAEHLAVRALASPTDWILGLHHRAQALIDDRASAEDSFRKSLTHLARTTAVPQLGRTHLLYGEWLRRNRRRRDARLQLESAHGIFNAIGATAFAERARDENLSTTRHLEHVTLGSVPVLTARELQIAYLVSDGHTNQRIGEKLYISPRTVEYHLRKTFLKLSITTRAQLASHLAHHGGSSA